MKLSILILWIFASVMACLLYLWDKEKNEELRKQQDYKRIFREICINEIPWTYHEHLYSYSCYDMDTYVRTKDVSDIYEKRFWND